MHKAEKLLKTDNSKIPLGLLVSMIHRTHMMYLNNRMRDMDITAGQFPFIMVLSNEEGIYSGRTGSTFSY